MSENDPNAVPPSWQQPPSDWGQPPVNGSHLPLPPAPPPPPGYQQPYPGQLPPPPPPGYQQPYTPYGQFQEQKTEPLAIASLVVSLVGVLCFGVVTGLVGIGLGVAARGRIGRDPSRKGTGLATAGIIVGACVFLLSLLSIFVIARRGSL